MENFRNQTENWPSLYSKIPQWPPEFWPKNQPIYWPENRTEFLELSPRCIVWNYDIFGFNGGRTREIADLIASKGFTVLIPDYYRGEAAKKHTINRKLGIFIKRQTHWEKLKKDWKEVVLPYAKRHGCTSFGAAGTCWGSYMVVRWQFNYPLKVTQNPTQNRHMKTAELNTIKWTSQKIFQ